MGHWLRARFNVACKLSKYELIYICLRFQRFYNYFSCVWLHVFLVSLLEYFANQDCLLVPSVGPAVTFCWERLGREAELAVGRLMLGSVTLPMFQRELCKLVSWLVLHMVAYNGHCILSFCFVPHMLRVVRHPLIFSVINVVHCVSIVACFVLPLRAVCASDMV